MKTLDFKTQKQRDRFERLMPNGMPRYIRCYDNGGETADRYTVVFTGHYKQTPLDQFLHIGMSENPFHPMGVGCHGASDTQIDRPAYSHLGRKIKFNDLPEDCKKCILENYLCIWNLMDGQNNLIN